jgi:hypothetical protein
MRLFASIGAGILFIIAAIAVVLGFLYILGSGSSQGSDSGLLTGVIIIGFGMVCAGGGIALIFFNRRQAKKEAAANAPVTLNVDLPGEMRVDSMKCESCGGVLSSNDISMVAGAPVVTCPYCNTTYQISEEPKW